MPDFKLSDAAKLAGVPIKKMTRDIDRGVIEIQGGEPGKGNPRRFNLDCIYKTAIGWALARAYVPPKKAMALAQLYFEPQRGRVLGRPFADGKTLMLVTDGVGSIINLQIDQDISPHLRQATIVVDIGNIISTVNARLIN
jgi:hypothetical protein